MKKLYYTSYTLLLLVLGVLISCNQSKTTRNETAIKNKEHKKIEYKKPKSVAYHFEKTKEWLKTNETDSTKTAIVYAINRTDKKEFSKNGFDCGSCRF